MARTRAVAVSLAPLALFLIASVIVVANAGSLPPDVATQWGPDGAVEATGSRLSLFIPGLMLMSVGVAAGLGGLIGFKHNPFGQRIALGFAAGFGVFASVNMVAMNALQWGLQSGRLAPDPSGAIGGGMLAGVLAGIAAGYLAGTPQRVPSAASVRPVWSGRAEFSPVVRWVVGGILVAAATTLIVLSFMLDAVVLLGIAAAVLVSPVAAGVGWRVTVDPTGIIARAATGWPRLYVPMSAVNSALVVDVAWGEWGGLGVRSRRASNGLITRSGPGVKVWRNDGTSFTFTVDDAAGAASVISSLLEQRQA